MTNNLEIVDTLNPPDPSGSPAWHVTFSNDGRYLACCLGNPDTRVLVWERRIRGGRRIDAAAADDDDDEYGGGGGRRGTITSSKSSTDDGNDIRKTRWSDDERTNAIRTNAWAMSTTNVGSGGGERRMEESGRGGGEMEEEEERRQRQQRSRRRRRHRDYEWTLISTIRCEGGGEDDGRSSVKAPRRRTVRCAAFAPTSSTLGVPLLATASFDGRVLIWEHRDRGDDYDYHRMDGDYDDDANDGDYDDNDDDDGGGDDGENFGGRSERGRRRRRRAALGERNNFYVIAELEGHESEVKGLAWNETGSLLASCGRDKTIWLWECFLPGTVGGGGGGGGGGGESGGGYNGGRGMMAEEDDGELFECLAVLQGHDGDIKYVTFGPSHDQFGDGREVLYSASYDDTVKVWAEECGDWYCAMTLSATVHTSSVLCLVLSPGGVRLYSGSTDGSIAIWRMATRDECRRRRGGTAMVGTSIAIDGGSWDCVGKLPDAHSGYAVTSIDCAPSRAGHGGVASCGGDDTINIYREVVDATTNALVASSDYMPKFKLDSTAEYAHDGDVNCVRWHPADGNCLVSCGDDGAVRIWSPWHDDNDGGEDDGFDDSLFNSKEEEEEESRDNKTCKDKGDGN
ncbi:hypothetical protein ACHAXA_010380 [Cyclostephanos tholiformis]|uniref:Probable cytosolic iron-sulfur protein assembly protein CIAO1 homolog n=1 Tax=Cyclostephanos tholiformis TaxID=382380 RepID=A0ABD3RS47_9STRA